MEHNDRKENVEIYGFCVYDKVFSMLFAIDTKYIPQDLSAFHFDVIFIEANYLEDTIKFALLDAQKKQKC